jgi:RNA-splicing ligase RtcB
MIFKEQTKSVPIAKEMVWESYKKVKSNGGSAGIGQQICQILTGYVQRNCINYGTDWPREVTLHL